MTDLERQIFKALSEADDQYEADGASSSKTWIREYFLPALERHDLEIKHRVDPCVQCGRAGGVSDALP